MSPPSSGGAEVTLVELKDIQLPDSMKRARARQAEAEREKRAKIINAEGESLAAAALGEASDIMTAHPLALQLRNLQSLVEIGVDKNTTVVFPAPLMTTIAELGSFLTRGKQPPAARCRQQAAARSGRQRRARTQVTAGCRTCYARPPNHEQPRLHVFLREPPSGAEPSTCWSASLACS
jgi:hypothetical protein